LRLVIGRIGRAHGLRGEVTVEPRTDQPESRFKVGTVLETEPSSNGPITVETFREHNGTYLLSFKGKLDRNSAELLRGTQLLSDIEIPKPDANMREFHISQIVGLQARTIDGEIVGQVVDVLDHPAHDTLVIKSSNGEILVPFVTKHVPKVDLENKAIVISNFEGII
jgi:16S rRNA processing protein RimM